MSDVLGFDAQDIIGSNLGDYLHPLDHWRLNLCCDAPRKPQICLLSFSSDFASCVANVP